MIDEFPENALHLRTLVKSARYVTVDVTRMYLSKIIIRKAETDESFSSNLKTRRIDPIVGISVSTAYLWIVMVGCTYEQSEKSYHTDIRTCGSL